MTSSIGYWNGPGAPDGVDIPECPGCGRDMERRYDPYPGGGTYWVCVNPKCEDREGADHDDC